jgi:hypothetical protein
VTGIADPDLRARLEEVGLDPDAPGEAGEAWRRLHARFGRRVTLLERYALEAAAHGVTPEALEPSLRDRLALEVLRATYDGFEVVRGEGRSRHRRDPIEVVRYDPSWPARFARWRARLAEALRDIAPRIEHIGSTAVPGLAAGGAWERDHLLLRDFLRADATTADAYGRLKAELAARHRDDRIAYNEAKTAFILDALAAAEAWAKRGSGSSTP